MIQVPPLLPGHSANVLALTPSPKMSGYLIMALINTAMKKITLSLIILASTGFSIEVEASDFKVRIVKEQSPIAEVVKLLDKLTK
jgi:hypothetical protein